MKLTKKFTLLYGMLALSISPICLGQFATHMVMTCIDDSEPSLDRGEIDINKKLLQDSTITKALLEALKSIKNNKTLFPHGLTQEALPLALNEINKNDTLKALGLTTNMLVHIGNSIHKAFGNLLPLGAIATTLLVALLEEQCAIITCSSVMHYLTSYLSVISDNPFNLLPKKTIQPNNWIATKIDDYLYLLIPKTYASSGSNYKKLISLDLSKSQFSAEELALGLKFKNNAIIASEDFLKPATYKKYATYPTFAFKEDISIQGISPTGMNWSSSLQKTMSASWISHNFIQQFLIRTPLVFTHKKVASVHQGRSTIFITNEEYRETFAHLSPSELKNIIAQPIIIATGHGSPYHSIKEEIKLLEKKQATLQTTESELTNRLKNLKQLYAQGKKSYLGGQVAGFNSKDFGTFTHFLAQNTSAKLLFFDTCFGNEINLQEALHDIEDETSLELSQSIFPFPIITGVIANATAVNLIKTTPSYKQHPLTHERSDIKNELKRPLFKNFFDTLNTSAAPSHKLLLQALDFIYPLDLKSNNIPLIKSGNLPWQPLTQPETFVTLNEAFIKTHGSQPFSFTQHNLKPAIIFVETYDIPTPLIIDIPHMPVFLSTIPGDAVHSFIEIQAPKNHMSEFLRSFFSIEDLKETKAFFIKKLITLDEKNKQVASQNVVIINYFKENNLPQKLVYFNEKLYSFALKPDQKGIVRVVLTELSDQALFNTIKNELAQFPKLFLRPKTEASDSLTTLAHALNDIQRGK